MDTRDRARKADIALAEQAAEIRAARYAGKLRGVGQDFALLMASAGYPGTVEVRSAQTAKPVRGWRLSQDLLLATNGRLYRLDSDEESHGSDDVVAIEDASDELLNLRSIEIKEGLAGRLRREGLEVPEHWATIEETSTLTMGSASQVAAERLARRLWRRRTKRSATD
jgi:hypothetical protein